MIPAVESLVVVDIQFLVDVFKAIITMWQFRDMSNLRLSICNQLKMELEQGILSSHSLSIVWRNLRKDKHQNQGPMSDEEREALTTIMLKFHEFIPYGAERKGKGKFMIPALLPPYTRTTRQVEPFRDIKGAKPLRYFFHFSDQPGQQTASAFLPSGLYATLIANLTENFNDGHAWVLNGKPFFSTSQFRAGEHKEALVSVSCHGAVVILEVFGIPGQYRRSKECMVCAVRQFFETRLGHLLTNSYPRLKCSVCVLPCGEMNRTEQLEERLQFDPNCLETLGALRRIDDTTILPSAACMNNNCNRKRKHLGFEEYRCWFCHELNKQPEDRKRRDYSYMRKASKKVTDITKLRDLCVVLLDSIVEAERQNTNEPNISKAAFSVMRYWYDGENGLMDEGSPKLQQFKDALDEAEINFEEVQASVRV